MPTHTVPLFTFAPITPTLLAGRAPITREDVAELAAAGVTHVLDLRQAEEWSAPTRLGAEAIAAMSERGIARRNVPVADGGAPSLEELDEAVAFLQRAFLDQRPRVYVHCRAGIERTGAAVVAWWAWEHGTSVRESLDAIHQTNTSIAPLPHQRDAVRKWLRATRPNRVPTLRGRIRGCVLGGAAGDALGAAVEFKSLKAIRAIYGPAGIRRYAPEYGRDVAITDDTQMTAFTIEGLIRASVRGRSKGMCHPPSVVMRAYWRWLSTQGELPAEEDPFNGSDGRPAWLDGWLVREPVLHHRRAPGNSCLSALQSGRFGTPQDPINDSKGCGSVMRGAPVGFVRYAAEAEMFTLGCEIGALTHGHRTGYSSAGALAVMVEGLRNGETLEQATATALGHLNRGDFGETRRALQGALDLAAQGNPTAAQVESLGAAWIAEEALAIALYCALAAPSFEEALVLAANHSGDSDSTAAICGNLLGARDGVFAIPVHFLRELEGKDVLCALADDLALVILNPPRDEYGGASEAWFERYPGW